MTLAAAAVLALLCLAAGYLFASARHRRRLVALADDLERMRANANREAKRAQEYFDTIDGVVQEANGLRHLYSTMGAQHGNAQAILLRQIERIAKQYTALVAEYRQATGGKSPRKPEPTIDPVVQQVTQEFREDHVEREVETPNTDAARGRPGASAALA